MQQRREKYKRLKKLWLHHSLDLVGTSILVTFVAIILSPFYLRGMYIWS